MPASSWPSGRWDSSRRLRHSRASSINRGNWLWKQVGDGVGALGGRPKSPIPVLLLTLDWSHLPLHHP